MAITADQFIETCARGLQRGQSEQDAGVYPDWIAALLPVAMPAFAAQIAIDPRRRGMLMRKFEINLTEGVGELLESDARQMLKAGLAYAGCYDTAQRDPVTDDFVTLVWKKNWQDIEEKTRYLDPTFSYFALRDNTIVTRSADAVGTIIGPLHLYCSYIPDFDAYPLPYELVPDAVQQVLNLALPAMGVKPKVK